MSYTDVGSGMRWMSASNIMYWHHSHSTCGLNSHIWGQLGRCNGVVGLKLPLFDEGTQQPIKTGNRDGLLYIEERWEWGGHTGAVNALFSVE
jgi:hypothetical protein